MLGFTPGPCTVLHGYRPVQYRFFCQDVPITSLRNPDFDADDFSYSDFPSLLEGLKAHLLSQVETDAKKLL